MFFGIDPLYLLMLAPAMLLAGLATVFTQSTFSKYAKQQASSGMTGAEAAQTLLNRQGIFDVKIERVEGFLSDHYDPLHRTLRLSPAVYDESSLSAIGVACHEAGHALQHAAHYAPLTLRSSMVPLTQLGSNGSYILFLIGMLMNIPVLIKFGILLFAVVVVFSIITLPVEWNASARAKVLMVKNGIVTTAEQPMAASVLNAAFMTYVASAFTALMTLLYYLLRSGLLGGRRNN